MAEQISSKSNTSPTQNGSTTATKTATKKNNIPNHNHRPKLHLPTYQNLPKTTSTSLSGPPASRLTLSWISWTSWRTSGWMKCGC